MNYNVRQLRLKTSMCHVVAFPFTASVPVTEQGTYHRHRMHKRRHKNVMPVHTQRVGLGSNILEVALFGKKLKRPLLVADGARTRR